MPAKTAKTRIESIKEAYVARLIQIQDMVEAGDMERARYALSDIIDQSLSSRVSIKCQRAIDTSRPGDCANADELVWRNID